jgi:hypothetical protein
MGVGSRAFEVANIARQFGKRLMVFKKSDLYMKRSRFSEKQIITEIRFKATI